MFGNLGIHITKFPSGRFGFVGSIPVALCDVVPAQKHNYINGSAWEDEKGEMMAYKSPVFDDSKSAVEHAKSKGVELCSVEGCSCRNYF